MLNKVFITPYIIIDLSKIGFQGKAYLMINSTGSNSKLTVELLHQIPNVFLIVETIGKFDLTALVAFRDIKEVKKIVSKIRAQPSVKKVHVAITEQTDFPTKRKYGTLKLFGNKIFDDIVYNEEKL